MNPIIRPKFLSPMWLDDASQYLGWPKPDQVTNPRGGGPSHYARQIEQKIGASLRRHFSLREIQTGVLVGDPSADTAEAPLAIVCQFDQNVGDDVLRETQRLCWNFSRASLLVTLEPNRIQAWSCALAPRNTKQLNNFRVIPALELQSGDTPGSLLQRDIAQQLHWVNLVSGEFLRRHETKFRKEERADTLLVSNLRAVRKQLLTAKPDRKSLDRDVCHALLARLIFIQFLFHRTDSEGHPAISQTVLDNRFNGYLKQTYEHATALENILLSKEETYAFFRWLNEKFNGDLFPGKGSTPEEREAEWQAEKNEVRREHLKLLSEFVSGKIDLENRQQSFWPEYRFDTLPLEFISSVYEEFLNEDQLKLSAYYTPTHLVDFVLDGVLSWGGKDWNLKILDPCCGSGIFLVKAFQRLVQRWKRDHPDQNPGIDDLRGLLENNLLGIDASAEAIRVASFSLCLALCDAIDPKHYWKRTLFPRLRNVRLIESDFFAEDNNLFCTKQKDEERIWDIVIGNAPWRSGSLEDSSPAATWAEKNKWPIADKNPGPLFLAKAALIAKTNGSVAMIQPAAALLHQNSRDASIALRKKLFTEYTVEEIVNFSLIRFQLFSTAVSPSCLVTLRPTPPDSDATVTYICPKPLYSSEDDSLISIDRSDIHEVTLQEAKNDLLVWSVLLVGSRRDLLLIHQLHGQPTLGKLRAKSKETVTEKKPLLIRRGFDRGISGQTVVNETIGRRILENPSFPTGIGIWLDAESLPKNLNPKFYHTSDFSAFELPQLIIKQSILKSVGRFQAALVRAKKETKGVLASKSYTTVHQLTGGDDWLRSACLSLHSRLSAYFLALTSRITFYRPEALSGEILNVPVPSPNPKLLPEKIDIGEVDALVEEAFGLKESERVLISDLVDFAYRDGGTNGDRPGRAPTIRNKQGYFGDLYHYADFLLRTLRATFGKERTVKATIFEETQLHDLLPVRLVAIHLHWPHRRLLLEEERLESSQLRRLLSGFYRDHLGIRNRQGVPITSGLGFQRSARLFISHDSSDGTKVPTVIYIKPDQRRYWTRSQALRDADELAVAIMTSGQRHRTTK